MPEEPDGSFQTRARSITEIGELQWGTPENDWNDEIETSSGVTVTDSGTTTPGDSIPNIDVYSTADHRYILDDVETGTVSDTIGSADGTVNGVTSTDGTYSGGSAGDGDGSSAYISFPLSSWASTYAQSAHTVTYTFQTSATTRSNFFGVLEDFERWRAWLTDTGNITYNIEESGPSQIQIKTTGNWNDGNTHRVALRKQPGDTADTLDIFVDGARVSTTIEKDTALTGFSFSQSLYLFARHYSNTDSYHLNGIIDDVILFPTDLTSTQIEEDYNAQVWS